MNLEERYSRRPDRLYPNFRAMFDALCAEHAARPALRMGTPGEAGYRAWSYAELKRDADAAARWLVARGIGDGARAAIIGENSPEWCLAYIAAALAGAVIVPLDASLDAEGAAALAEAASVKALFYAPSQEAKAERVRAALPQVTLVRFDGPRDDGTAAAGAAGRFSWSRVASAGESVAGDAADALPLPDPARPEDPAVIIFTSGTTGVSKGIVLSHGGVIANVNAALQALFVDERDVFIAILPLHHTYAATCTFLAPLVAGGLIVFPEKLIPTVILRRVREARVSVLIGVPLLFDKIKKGMRSELAKLPRPASALVGGLIGMCSAFAGAGLPVGRFALSFLRKKAGIASVRLAVSGGGPLAWDTASFYEAIGLNLVQGYGMSENGPLISVNLPDYKDNKSAGLPVKRTELRVAEAGPDGIGEIQVKSPSIMLGYLDRPDATAEAMTEDGWLRTGDLGYLDARGFLFITGRSKNLIVTEGGKNVYPEEIELRFEGSPWVREVLVVGRREAGRMAGEEIVAVCVPDWERIAAELPGADPKAAAEGLVRDEVRRVNRTLPPHMKVEDFVIRDEEFEKTSSRKIKRFLYKCYAEREGSR